MTSNDEIRASMLLRRLERQKQRRRIEAEDILTRRGLTDYEYGGLEAILPKGETAESIAESVRRIANGDY